MAVFNMIKSGFLILGVMSCLEVFLAQNTMAGDAVVNQVKTLKLERFVGSLQDDRNLDFQTADEGAFDTNNILIKMNSKMAADSQGNLYVTGPRIIKSGFAKSAIAKISPAGKVSRIMFEARGDITSISIDKNDVIYIAELNAVHSQAGRGGSEFNPFPFFNRFGRGESHFKIYKLSQDGRLSKVIGKTTSDLFYSFAVDSNGTLYSDSYRSLKQFNTRSFFGGGGKVIINYETNPYKDFDDIKKMPVYYNQLTASHLMIDRLDNLYFTESNKPMMLESGSFGGIVEKSSDAAPHDAIKKMTPAGVITLVAGSSEYIGSIDGASIKAGFQAIDAMCLDEKANLYVFERNSNTIRKVSAAGVVTRLLSSPEISNVLSLASHGGSLYVLNKKGIYVIRNGAI